MVDVLERDNGFDALVSFTVGGTAVAEKAMGATDEEVLELDLLELLELELLELDCFAFGDGSSAA